MARERWFLAQGRQRRGPLPLTQLVETLCALGEPRAALVWRKGLPAWTRAGDVAEVERRLVPPPERQDAAPSESRADLRASAGAATRPGSNATVYGALFAGMLALALVGWLFWPRPQLPTPVAAGEPSVAPGATPASPLPTATAATGTPSTPAPRPTRVGATGAREAALEDRETNLPAAELRRLRGVAVWAGESLRLTVNNGTSWRITELGVRVFRFTGEDFVPDPDPVLLLPPGAVLDAGVADLMNRVAPDRKRAGVNPQDTGAFEVHAGPRPENFRWELTSARGYPPRR